MDIITARSQRDDFYTSTMEYNDKVIVGVGTSVEKSIDGLKHGIDNNKVQCVKT